MRPPLTSYSASEYAFAEPLKFIPLEATMRFLLKAVLDTERANHLARTGNLGSVIKQIVDEQKPEAAYFTDDHGKRTALVILDMKDVSQVPALAEPWFLALNAHIEFHPLMVAADLEKAGPGIEKAAKTYGQYITKAAA